MKRPQHQPAAMPNRAPLSEPRGGEVALFELWVQDGSRHWRAVRWELFVFRAVRDVLPTVDPERVLVVHRGPPEPEAWAQVLGDAGFDAAPGPTRRPGATTNNRYPSPSPAAPPCQHPAS